MTLPCSFAGKTILVTGGGRGLGKALVKALVQNQGKVIALSRTKEMLDKLKAELPAVSTVCCDLQNWDETRQVVKSIGHVDHLVNNAAQNIPGKMMKVSPQDFDNSINSNLKSVLNVTQVVVDGMLMKNSGGSIVNISSIASKMPIDRQGMYGVSKAGLDIMMKNFALELGPHNIRVNSICPGLFPSDMSQKALDNPKSHMVKNILTDTPLRRIATVDEVLNAVLFLLSDHSSYISGQCLSVCGGLIYA